MGLAQSKSIIHSTTTFFTWPFCGKIACVYGQGNCVYTQQPVEKPSGRAYLYGRRVCPNSSCHQCPDQLKGDFEKPRKKQKEAKKKGRCRICRSLGPWTASPSPFLEQPLQILPSRSHECLTLDAPESSETKAPHAMPVFARSL